MEFSPLKKPFQINSNSSFRHLKKVSETGSNDGRNDSQTIIKVDGGDGWSSNNGSLDIGAIADEMKLVSRQEVEDGRAGSDMDMDMEMGEFRGESQEPSFPRPMDSSSSLKNQSLAREIRVSFEPSISGSIDNGGTHSHHHHNHHHQQQQQKKQEQTRADQVLRCTSSTSFQRQTSLLSRLKTRSRLLDLPSEETERMSGKIVRTSGQLKSGLLGRVMEEEEDDPLEDEDLPDEYKRDKLSAFTVLQWLGLVAIAGGLACSLLIATLRESNFLKLRLWKWEVLLLVLICGRLVSGWGIRVIVFLIERNFLLRKRVLYFVYGLRKGVQNCLWLGIVLLAWHYLFDTRIERETRSHLLKYLTKILICFLAGNCIWLVKTLMVKVLASSFHVSTYFDRIQESLFNQYVIETLSGKPLVEIKRLGEEMERMELKKATVLPPGKSMKFSREICNDGEDGIRIDHLHKLNTRNVSAWNMKRLMNIVRLGSLSTLDEKILGSGASIDDESATHIRSEYQAKSAARKIFYNVARSGSKYIYLVDLMRFMREDEALKILSFFEGASDTSKISKSSLKNWVVNAFRERRALSLTLNDTKTAVNKLHQVINIIVAIIILVIWLLILGIATSKFFVLIGSQLLVASFIFGNTAKTLFESIIFLFIIHPFDVGDRCEIDGIQMVVEEMNILTTIFLRADNQKIVFPNSVLAAKPIGNFYRSPDMGDSVEFCIHISTPIERLATMKHRITSYIENEKEHWYPNPAVVLMNVEELNKLRLAVWFRHRMNHQDMGEKWMRRACLLEEMVKIFKDLDIQFRLLPLDINVLTIPLPNHSHLVAS